MKTTQVLRIQPANLTDLARRYRALMDDVSRIEEMLKPYRQTLESEAIANGGTLELDGFKVTATPASREVFSLKEAREVLAAQVLQPFVRVSAFIQLRVTEKKAA